MLSDFDMISVPGEDVDESEFYIRYAPNLCKMFPAKLYIIGFHIVDTAVVAKLIRFAKMGTASPFYYKLEGIKVHA